MSIKIGDKVRFLNDIGGGIITQIIDKQHVMVENETGFDVPISVKEIIVIEEAVDDSTKYSKTTDNEVDAEINIENNNIDLDSIFYPEVNEIEDNKDIINLYFAFVPQGRAGNSNLNIYLVNDSNYNIFYSIINKDDLGNTFSNGVGVLDANTKMQIDTLALQSVNQMPEYIFHFVFYKQGDFVVKQPLVKNVKINPIKFYKEKTYLENDFFNEDAIIVSLTKKNDNEKIEFDEKEIKKIIQQKEKVEHKPKAKSNKQKEKEIIEIDLHINELLDDCRGLTNGEMLEIQIDKFKAELTNAKKQGVKRIVFIHGVGNGTLKNEVRKYLEEQKNMLTYHDASFKEYGYGATMVKLK